MGNGFKVKEAASSAAVILHLTGYSEVSECELVQQWSNYAFLSSHDVSSLTSEMVGDYIKVFDEGSPM